MEALKMKAIVVLIVIAAILSGCTSTKVWRREWSLDSGNRIAEISENTAEHSARIELKDGTVFNARSLQITPDLSSGILSDGRTRSWKTEMTSQIFYERRSTKKLGWVSSLAPRSELHTACLEETPQAKADVCSSRRAL